MIINLKVKNIKSFGKIGGSKLLNCANIYSKFSKLFCEASTPPSQKLTYHLVFSSSFCKKYPV